MAVAASKVWISSSKFDIVVTTIVLMLIEITFNQYMTLCIAQDNYTNYL